MRCQLDEGKSDDDLSSKTGPVTTALAGPAANINSLEHAHEILVD